MMTGDRRWAPGRRTGMTVLGKVTVPKPINLPSQRLENHGLDPNVEIVPKGTLNWGNRSSPSAQIAWASPAQSPPKTGGIGSPSYLNGRPSSGGSGTRPSTAGSDRSHEPVPNVWGSSSRPSSASGVPVSNQTSLAAARPRSAEPRPASSQLSRFAEPISENSVAWGASGTMERLAISSTKSKDFSLSTGDFPTLGSEKTTESNLQQGHSSHGRPVSASGRTATPKQLSETSLCDDGSMDASKERGGVNTLQNNNILEVEPGDPPNTERWQRETKPFPDQNMPQQFGPWHGSLPHNPPNGVWYRGPYGGGPYGPPGPPGSYPHEPFAYYHPRFPARPAANLQPVLPPGTAPSGYFPDKGDSHRPHMPDSYVQPVMPFGPGPYPVQVQYDGYYGPPCAGSCIPNEQRPPVMGMATAPCVYNRYPMQNVHPDPGNFHGPSGYGSGSTRAKEQGGSSHLPGTRQGPYKLLKHQDGWDETDSKEKREHTVSIPCLERDSMPGTPIRETGQGANQGHGEQLSFSKASNVTAASQYADSHGGHSPVSVGMDLPERKFKDNRIDDSSVRKQEVESVPVEDPQKFMSKRNPTLIEKIESLNNKARMSDGRHEEKLKSLRVFSAKAEDTTHEAGVSIVHPDKGPTVDYPDKAPTSGILSAPNLKMHPTGGKRQEAIVFSGADVSRQVHENQPSVVSVLNSSTSGGMIHRNTQNRLHGVQGRTDNRSKGRSNFPKDEEWRKKPLDAEFSAEGSYNKEDICEDNVPDPHASVRSSEKSSPDQGKVGGDFSALDTSGHQRAKMRETVAERSKQLQKEEEERTREQKARALAKLEELNRRSLAETSTEKVDGVQHKGVNSQFNASPMTAANASSDVAGSASGWDCDIVTFNNDYDTRGHENVPPEAQLFSEQDPTDTTNLTSLPLEVEAKDVTDHSTSRGRDSIVPKPKQVGHKRKQNMNKNLSDKSISNIDSGHVKGRANVAGDVDSSSGQVSPHGNTNATDASLLKHKKKNSRSGKSKHKLDEVPSPKLVQMDGNSVKPSSEINSLKTSVSVFEVGSVQVPFSIEISETQDPVVSSTDQGWSLSTEGVHGVVNNQLKPHPRRMPRSTQGTRITEKFYGSDSVVWAPVGALKKNDGSDAAVNSTIEVHTSSVTGRGTHSNNKSRRAEMERYVPKPVAKELSGLGSSEQPPSSSFNQAALTVSPGRAESVSLNKETSGPEGSSSEKAGLPVVSKIGESKPNKHGKTHGLWRPRITGESISVQPSLEEPCNSLAPSKTVQKSFEQQQTSKTDLHLSKEQAKYPDIVNASISPTPNEPITDTGLKDQRVTSRGKRQSFKGHRGAVNIHNSDQSDLHGWETSEAGSQSTYVELKKLDGRVALGENHADDVHALSHWLPKSQAHTTHDHQRNSRGNGGHRDSSRVGKASKKDYPTQGGEHFGSRTDKDHSQSLVQPHSVKSNGQKTAVAGVRNIDHQEFKPEGKGVDSPKQGSHFADHHPANPAKINEQPENVNNQHEESFSGLRRQGHQNRVSRVHEVPQGVQNPGVQDSSKQQPRPNSGRRRQDSQYEYHRARPNGNESTEPFEEGSRYRERGQTHSKHVGVSSYARNSGAFRVAPTSSNRQQSPETVGSVV